MLLPGLAILFLIFPFTRIIPFESYNQPYALVVGGLFLLFRPSLLSGLPRDVALGLGYLAVLGTAMLAIESLNGLDRREIAMWLSYISPIFILPGAFWAMRVNPSWVRTMLSGGIIIWIFVGLFQMLVNPNFLAFLVSQEQDLGFHAVQSGRGVLSLAPEPTHHGLHLLVLGTALYILRGNKLIVGAALLATLAIAQSSFAVLAIGFGVTVWALTRPLARYYFFLTIAAALLVGSFLPLVLPNDSRMFVLLTELYEEGFLFFIGDASANLRIAGMILPIYESFRGGFLPNGISIDTWMETRNIILSQYRWVYDLSGNGPASGLGLPIYQAGILSFPVIFILFRWIIWKHRMRITGALTASAFFAFVGQLYLATPTFGLLVAACVYGAYRPRDLFGSGNDRDTAAGAGDNACFLTPAQPSPAK